MSNSALLNLPYLAASQKSEHVTVNEIVQALDAVVQLAVADRDLTAPPGSPSEGDRYLVAAGATGAWSGWDGDIALYAAGAWHRLQPNEGWRVWVADEDVLLVHDGSAWQNLTEALQLLTWAGAVDVARGSLGGATGVAVLEEEITGLSGSFVESTVEIPSRAILLGVSTRTVTAITGATSYDCGISGEASKFGGSLGIAEDSTNIGVIGPQAFYSATKIRLTANGSDFTGGAVRIAIHYLTCGVPS